MAFELPRLPPMGLTEDELQVYWQILVEKVEAQEALQDTAIADIQTLQSDMNDRITEIAAAQADATAAIADAAAAQTDATKAAREAARINSYPVPTSVLSAVDAGSDATITVANHTRYYPVQGTIDVPDVSVTGGNLTGRSYSTTYYVYYDDTTLADTTPTFLTTTTPVTAQVGTANGRHLVGVITTPALGGGGTSGGGLLPPGGGGGTDIP